MVFGWLCIRLLSIVWIKNVECQEENSFGQLLSQLEGESLVEREVASVKIEGEGKT